MKTLLSVGWGYHNVGPQDLCAFCCNHIGSYAGPSDLP